ncbi:MAG: sigma-70 family RNA polymerase sigma factor [Planctomycetaceae bacterium]|nr:sigma-70 family RNA polymerase sigma factor [Planctomycetaceae bacterium]
MLNQNLYKAICRYVGRFSSDEELVKDIVQEVFLRFEQNRQNVTNTRSWLYRTARNLIIDYCRRRNHAAYPVAIGDMIKTIPANIINYNPQNISEKKENINMMIKELNNLSQRHREVLRLKFQEGLKYAEIAEVINEPITTVSWLLHEALDKLRKKLNVNQNDISAST